ncbi:hypothetical protein [Pseudoalteromonas sp. T1lg75]|uniref:hypothetical protein n=1 Tax=Pseudoalteromonas sp. T1lg75 TaxID=2077102 RepID=UPI000CF6CD39|nr:hypothetical protein [Pseudoalteromonas sp. T1lg75]
MKNTVFILFAFLIAQPALCCTVPNFGPEFDKLIEITKLENAGEFYIEIPRLSSPRKPELYIETYTIESYELLTNGPVKKKLEAGESVSSEEYDREWAASRPIKTERLWWLKTKEGRVFKEIKIKSKQGLIHRVHAHWPVECCLCSTDAFSKPLENIGKQPNKSSKPGAEKRAAS